MERTTTILDAIFVARFSKRKLGKNISQEIKKRPTFENKCAK
jgi:hypothetical protein